VIARYRHMNNSVLVKRFPSSEKMAEKIFRPILTYTDECHRAASDTIANVLKEAKAKYVYGVTGVS